MLVEQYGQIIKEARLRKGWRQEDLARKARVSRAVLSRLETGKAKPVQSDTLERLLATLGVHPQLDITGGQMSRRVVRLEQEMRLRDRRERHLRLATTLAGSGPAAAELIARARQRVELWRRDRTCSSFYIDRWSEILALPPPEIARTLSSLGEWEDALLQNSPWPHA